MSSVGILVTVAALVIAAVALTAVGFAYKGVRGQALTQQQDQAITSLQGTVTSLQTANEMKDGEILALKRTIDDLQDQVKALREAVTQAAKVDSLRDEVQAGFAGMNGKFDALMRSLAPRTAH